MKEESFVVKKVRFLAEQDGPAERRFKDKISQLLKQLEEPVRAFLCQVQYEANLEVHVAVCVATRSLFRDKIKADIVNVFRGMFRSDIRLDFILLTVDQEKEISSVCRAFIDTN